MITKDKNLPYKSLVLIVLVILATLSYRWIQYLCIPVIINLLNAGISTNPNTFFTEHSYLIDTIICLIMLILYIPWFIYVSNERPFRMKSIKFSNFKLGQRGEKLSGILKLIIIGFGCSGVALLWLCFAEQFLADFPIIGQSIKSFLVAWEGEENHAYIWVFLSVVAVGPLVEEVLFRGIVYNYLEKMSRGWTPAIVSGIIFGLWHLEPVQVVYTAIIGIVIGIIYRKVKSIKVTYFIHFLMNFITTLPPVLNTESNMQILNIISLIMIVPTLVIIIKIIRSYRKEYYFGTRKVGYKINELNK